ncbi:hypothetical protein Tco_0525773 [Tanacetum coccineum]
MDTLDGRLLKSYNHKDLSALHFGILLCCEIITYPVKQVKLMGFLILPEHHIPLWPILGVLQIGIRAKVIENQGIPLVNAGELPEMDPYEEVAQQGQAHPLSPAYVPDPMELDEHVPVYVPETEHPEYHVPSDDDIQVEDQPYAEDASPTAESPGYLADSDLMEDDTDADSIDYPDEPGTDDEDPEEDDDEDLEEDLSEELDPEDDDKDPEEDPSEEHELEDEDTKEEEPSEGSDETEPLEENETAITPPPGHRRARISVRPQTPMVASTQELIDAFAAGAPSFPLPPTSPTYDQTPLGHRAAMIHIRDDIPGEDQPPRKRFVHTAPSPEFDVAESSDTAAARPPKGQYDFVDTVEAGQGLIHSPGHDARTIAKATDRVEDVGYVRALQVSEHRMMTSIEEVNLRTDRRDIRLKIDIVRGQRIAYETKLHEAHSSQEGRWWRISISQLHAASDITDRGETS